MTYWDRKHPEYMGKNVNKEGHVKKLHPPSLMQRKLFMELTRKRGLKEACVAAGYSPKTPTAKIISQLSGTTLRGELEKLGFNPQNVAKRIVDGLDAQMVKPLGQGKYVEAPDWTNRHRYLHTALRIFGLQVTGIPRESTVTDRSMHLNVYKTVFNLMDRSLQVAKTEQRDVEIAEIEKID